MLDGRWPAVLHPSTITPLEAKGVAESPSAIANAIYHATGVCGRVDPITVDKLLDRLPEAGD